MLRSLSQARIRLQQRQLQLQQALQHYHPSWALVASLLRQPQADSWTPAAKPFTLGFGVGGLPKFGAKEPQQDDGKQKADAPASNGAAAGLPLSEVQHAVLLSSCLA